MSFVLWALGAAFLLLVLLLVVVSCVLVGMEEQEIGEWCGEGLDP